MRKQTGCLVCFGVAHWDDASQPWRRQEGQRQRWQRQHRRGGAAAGEEGQAAALQVDLRQPLLGQQELAQFQILNRPLFYTLDYKWTEYSKKLHWTNLCIPEYELKRGTSVKSRSYCTIRSWRVNYIVNILNNIKHYGETPFFLVQYRSLNCKVNLLSGMSALRQVLVDGTVDRALFPMANCKFSFPSFPSLPFYHNAIVIHAVGNHDEFLLNKN